jgi:hypothetical protein
MKRLSEASYCDLCGCAKDELLCEDISKLVIRDLSNTEIPILSRCFCSVEHQKQFYEGERRRGEDELRMRRRRYYTRLLLPQLDKYRLFHNESELELVEDIRKFIVATVIDKELDAMATSSIAMTRSNLFMIGPNETIIGLGPGYNHHGVPISYDDHFIIPVKGVLNIWSHCDHHHLFIHSDDGLEKTYGNRIYISGEGLPYDDILDIGTSKNEIYILRTNNRVTVVTVSNFSFIREDVYADQPMFIRIFVMKNSYVLKTSNDECFESNKKLFGENIDQIYLDKHESRSVTQRFSNRNIIPLKNRIEPPEYAILSASHVLELKGIKYINVKSFASWDGLCRFIIKTDGTLWAEGDNKEVQL